MGRLACPYEVGWGVRVRVHGRSQVFLCFFPLFGLTMGWLAIGNVAAFGKNWRVE